MRHQTTIDTGTDEKLIGHAIIIAWIDRFRDLHYCLQCEAKI